MPHDLITVIDCQSVGEFTDALARNSTGVLKDTVFNKNRWVYRGVADERYTLTPTAFRDGVADQLLSLTGRIVMPDGDLETTQIFFEYTVLQRFYKALEKQGLAVPDNSPFLHGFFEHPARLVAYLYKAMKTNCSMPWPPPEIVGLMALAQHYKLPTRLLDWTYSPFVAAYFSCLNPRGEKIAVWCLDTAPLVNEKSPISIAYAASATNPNLQAQQGVFTLSRSWPTPGPVPKKAERRPLEERASEIKQLPGVPLLVKFTLPSSLASELKLEIANYGYTVSKIFPGYSGASEEAIEAPQITNPYGKWDCEAYVFVPLPLVGLASSIAALLDPDSGGRLSFDSVRLSKTGDHPEEYAASKIPAHRNFVYALQDCAHHIPEFKTFIFEGGSLLFTNAETDEAPLPDFYALANSLGLKRINR